MAGMLMAAGPTFAQDNEGRRARTYDNARSSGETRASGFRQRSAAPVQTAPETARPARVAEPQAYRERGNPRQPVQSAVDNRVREDRRQWQGANNERRDDRREWRDERRDDRRDWRDDRQADRRDWREDRRDNRRDYWRETERNRFDARQRWADQQRWNRDWRQDRRYDWERYRAVNRHIYRAPRYYAPHGWNYGYRSFSVGFYLSNLLYAQNYWISDPGYYRLPPAYGSLRWVRYYDDAVLVDVRDGYVVDVIRNFFW